MTADEGLRDRLSGAWPLFGLAVHTERLVLRLPTDDDLLALIEVVKAGIHPPDVMPFATPWSTLSSPALERGYLAYHWTNRTAWSPDAWELGLAVWSDGVPIGMQGIHARAFAAQRTVHTGSWLGRAYQGHGYGTEMRNAVLALAFDGLGAVSAETEAFLDNAASNAVSRSLGYEENGFGSLAPHREPRETRRFRMTAAGWRSRPRPPVRIEGLEACRDLFGA
jgi:RimJ/RimL family protein N-acetyltransferase